MGGVTDKLNDDIIKVNFKSADKDQRFHRFVEQYHFTEREAEVFSAILNSNQTVQEIATEISISRAALYRHISSMNNKTNTKDRKELLRFYYEKDLD